MTNIDPEVLIENLRKERIVDAKKYLSQAYYLDQRIDAKIEQIENLRALAAKITAAITDMPFNHSQTHQAMSEAICKIIDLQNEIAVGPPILLPLNVR